MRKIWGWDWATFIGIFLILRRHYPFLLVSGILVDQFTLKNLTVTILALLLCQFVLNFAQHFKTLQLFWLMYNDLFKKKGFGFRRYRLSDYFDLHHITMFFEQFGINPYLLIFHKDLNEAVCMVDSGTLGPETISDLVCVSRPMFKSYILIKQPPDRNMQPIEKLKIAHEVGHFALSPLYLSAKRTGGIFLAAIMIFFLWKFVDLSEMPLLLKISYGIIFFIKICQWVLLWLPTSLRDEMYADLFALYLLTNEEKQAIWRRFTSPRYKPELFFRNSKIITMYNKRRTAMFMNNLQSAMEGNANDYIEATISDMEMPLGFRFLSNLFWCSIYFSFGLFLRSGIDFRIWPWLIATCTALFLTALFQFFNNYADEWLMAKMETYDDTKF